MAKLALEKQAIENKHLKALLEIEQKSNQNQINIEKAKIDAMLKTADIGMKMKTSHEIHHKQNRL
ncbi:hypothetical protein [Rickettsiella massiliensis]|uniref:hypothetical protein n=1 Tax=Rickettsiella massiliensis TaxID=676517 RepID=UPI00029B1085|nr:hypothetical protein [Rickettsiella massiliensis]